MTVADLKSLLESQASKIPQSWSGKCTSIDTRLSELGRALTMTKTEGYGNGVVVPDKLREFLTNLAAMFPGEKSDAKIAERQVQQLAAAILDHGRLVLQFHSHHSVGVEERELASRFRETTHNIVSALVLLEKQGRASRTRHAGFWSLRVQPQNTKEVFTNHEDERRV